MSIETASFPRRRLGRTGLEATALGLGGAWIGAAHVTDEAAVQTVHRAIELGVNYLDTSAGYGDSERKVGLALQGSWREKIYLATKTGTHPIMRGDYSAAATRRSVENSLRLLGTDYLDVCLVHDPSDMDPVLAKGGALEALQRMREEGLVRFIGLGVRSHDFHLRAIATGEFDVILTYLDYTLIRQTAAERLLPFAARHDIGVVNGSPAGMGLLVGADPATMGRPDSGELQKARRLWEWAQTHHLSLLHLAIQFCMREPRIHINLSGSKSPGEIEQNIAAATTPLPEEIWRELEGYIRTPCP